MNQTFAGQYKYLQAPPNTWPLSLDVCRHHMFFHIVMQVPVSNYVSNQLFWSIDIAFQKHMKQKFQQVILPFHQKSQEFFSYGIQNPHNTRPSTCVSIQIPININYVEFIQTLYKLLVSPAGSRSGFFLTTLPVSLRPLTSCYQHCLK